MVAVAELTVPERRSEWVTACSRRLIAPRRMDDQRAVRSRLHAYLSISSQCWLFEHETQNSSTLKPRLQHRNALAGLRTLGSKPRLLGSIDNWCTNIHAEVPGALHLATRLAWGALWVGRLFGSSSLKTVKTANLVRRTM